MKLEMLMRALENYKPENEEERAEMEQSLNELRYLKRQEVLDGIKNFTSIEFVTSELLRDYNNITLYDVYGRTRKRLDREPSVLEFTEVAREFMLNHDILIGHISYIVDIFEDLWQHNESQGYNLEDGSFNAMRDKVQLDEDVYKDLQTVAKRFYRQVRDFVPDDSDNVYNRRRLRILCGYDKE